MLVAFSIYARSEPEAPSESSAQPSPASVPPVDEKAVDEKAVDEETGAWLVDLDDDVDAAELRDVARQVREAVAPYDWPRGIAALGTVVSPAARIYRLRPPASEVNDIRRALARSGLAEGVERERIWRLPRIDGAALSSLATKALSTTNTWQRPKPARKKPFVPNDPYYRHQWHLDQIQMPLAWTRSQGEGATVAVVDTGVSYRDHAPYKRAPDLIRTKFVPGYDFVDGDDHPDDAHGHGTHVAGTIAQSTHNGVGVAGVAPKAAIMPVRVLDARGAGSWGSVAAGIRFAADHGAHVINLSLGGGMASATIRRAIQRARRKGVVVIAAAGNTGRGRVQYPAAHAETLAVGAVRFDEKLAFYSSFGRHLDVVAPGGDLRVDQNRDGMPDGVLQNTLVRGQLSRHDYIAYQGTSMAAPHVAGIAALLVSQGIDQPSAIEGILRRTAKPKGSEFRYGHGLVRAEAALSAAGEELAGARGAAALALCGLMLLGLHRRRRLDVSFAPTLAVGFVIAGGLAALPWRWLLSAQPIAWMTRALRLLGDTASTGIGFGDSVWGPSLSLLIGASAAVPIALTLLLLSVRRLRPIVIGISFGTAAWLGIEAAIPTLHFGSIPGFAVGPWLAANAVLCAWLGSLAATKNR